MSEYYPENKITTVFYREVDFLWVSSYYDVNLSGLCYHNHRLCWFVTRENMFCASPSDTFVTKVDIYQLTYWQTIHASLRKKMFEWFVGYHCTFPNRKQGARQKYYSATNIFSKAWYGLLRNVYYGFIQKVIR
ncbi:MAG: hypothetical protein BV459_00505 [Thermoplasmata archaeon M11B2D]|nr:MAG: hypothetical protein BV459_00505 [Thermoplasmata archaeon M11B2D]